MELTASFFAKRTCFGKQIPEKEYLRIDCSIRFHLYVQLSPSYLKLQCRTKVKVI